MKLIHFDIHSGNSVATKFPKVFTGSENPNSL